MKVSVLMVTYNHEEFIAKAIDSILMQKTNFDYEIVIGEDCSADRTRDILMKYKNEYPDKIKLLLNEKNIGMHKNGSQVFDACNGKYIAMLEGDDYWISPFKLQKQVDFLETHPTCAICFHNVVEVYKDNLKPPHNFFESENKEFYTLEDLLKGNFIPTPSTMFRNGLITEIPDWFETLPMGDWPLHILNALHGKIGYLDEVMAAHLNHGGGVWFGMRGNWLEAYKADETVYNALYEHLDNDCKKMISTCMHDLYIKIAWLYEDKGDLESAKKYAMRAFAKNLILSEDLLKLKFKIYAPTIYRIAKILKESFVPLK